jgi:hypothetical protein
MVYDDNFLPCMMQEPVDKPELDPGEAEATPASREKKSLKRSYMWLPIQGYGTDGEPLVSDPESRKK